MKKKIRFRKTGKYILIFLLSIILFIFSFKIPKNEKTFYFKWNDYPKEITSVFNYSEYVKTKKEINLYDKTIKKCGSINKDISLELESLYLYNNKLYFKIKNLDYYIEPYNIKKIQKFENSNRYKKYIVFNKNVITKNNTTFYNENGYAYKINNGINLPLIINDKDKYYVEYNNELLYIKKEDSSLKDNKNTNEITRDNIRVLTYHAIYKEGESCKNKSICHPYKQFNEHMKYLKDNNYFTLTMKELELFLDKKINIPKNSIVITLDDGNLAKNAIEILDKYELNATYFIITGKYDSYKLETKYVDFESHTDNLHNNYKCPGGNQGGQLLCEKEDIILKDLKTSQEKLGGSKYLSYPFFDYNERAIALLKKSGFHLAFVGQATTDGYNTYNTDRFKIRRKTVFASDSLEKFKNYLK